MTTGMAFADALRALNAMKAEGVIEEYAIAGAMALVFWTEPVPTFDLDVLVLLPKAPGAMVSLSGIYRWAEARGYPAQEEHILVEGLPTQFVPSPNLLGREAIQAARDVDYQGVVVRVVPPEYLDRPVSAARGQDREAARAGGHAARAAEFEPTAPG